MSAVLARTDPRRLRRLEAMGICTYALRQSAASASAAADASARPGLDDEASRSRARLTIVCAQLPQARDCDSLLRALGLGSSLVHWLNLEKEALSTLPKDAVAYLVLGQQLARVVGAELPTVTQQITPIVVVDAPSRWHGDAMAKRLCWQALRPLVRALHATRS